MTSDTASLHLTVGVASPPGSTRCAARSRRQQKRRSICAEACPRTEWLLTGSLEAAGATAQPGGGRRRHAPLLRRRTPPIRGDAFDQMRRARGARRRKLELERRETVIVDLVVDDQQATALLRGPGRSAFLRGSPASSSSWLRVDGPFTAADLPGRLDEDGPPRARPAPRARGPPPDQAGLTTKRGGRFERLRAAREPASGRPAPPSTCTACVPPPAAKVTRVDAVPPLDPLERQVVDARPARSLSDARSAAWTGTCRSTALGSSSMKTRRAKCSSSTARRSRGRRARSRAPPGGRRGFPRTDRLRCASPARPSRASSSSRSAS